MRIAFFGQYLLNEGIINAVQLTEAVELQEELNVAIGKLAQDKGLLNSSQVKDVLRLQIKEDLYFGEAAERLGFLTDREIERLLKEQKEKYIYLGEAFVRLGYLTEEKLKTVLDSFSKARDEHVNMIDHRYPEELEEEKPFINEFVLFTIKMLRRMGGVVVKYDRCQLKKKEIDLSPIAIQINFSASVDNRISRFTVMIAKKTANIIATKIYRCCGLAIDRIYRGSSVVIDEAVVEDVISELVNLICGQAFNKFSKGDELRGGLPEKKLFKEDGDSKYILKNGEKAAYVSLFTPFGPVSFFLIFNQ